MKSLTLIILFLFSLLVSGQAQKLPNKQEVSVWAPANIKVDGKTDDWLNQFQAYNHATDIFYTVANDDKNFYLIIRAAAPNIINNIIDYGLKFSINLSGKKTENGAFSITYPYFEENKGFNANLKNRPKFIVGSDASFMRADSFVNATNKRMTEKMKLIKISNRKVSDTVISIYNEDGIRTASLFDNKMSYTHELSISLKELGITVNNSNKFTYHIVINGIYRPGTYALIDKVTHQVRYEVNPPGLIGEGTTDFWGEYTLAKKP